MNVRWYLTKNWFRKVYVRAIHPWPLYKKVGGINAVVIRGNSGEHGKPGEKQELKNVSPVYAKRWGTGAGA